MISTLELLVLSIGFMASSICFYLWAAIRDDNSVYLKKYVRILLFVSMFLGYTSVITSCSKLLLG